MIRSLLAASLLVQGATETGLAQAAAPRAPFATTATAMAVRAPRPPVLDGKDDDAIWQSAPTISAFREFQPHEDGDPRFRTEFRVAYDNENLYVFVRAYDPHPDSIMHALTRHDVRGPSDQIILLIDSYDDHRTGYDFDVNPDGVKREYAIYADGNEDASWDGIWDVATRVDSLGWTAEFRVPFSQLRYPDAVTHTFGFAVWRDIERFKERVSWPLYRPSKNGFVSQIGQLEGIAGITSPRHAELTPYTAAKNSSRALNTGYDRLQQGTVGADLKLNVSPNMTIDGTVNPDFGQVESDPAVLNLSAFETFLRERRPFFVEGTGLYQFQQNCNAVNCNNEGLFYSRRIGREPQLLGDFGDASSPTATPILAAGKLTGRLGNGLALGFLDASTQRVQGTEQRTIEPRTNYAVFRLQQDLRNGQSGIGFISTAVDRTRDSWSGDSLRQGAYVNGMDFRNRFFGGQWELSGSATVSHVTGSAAAIASTQRDDVHDYQRAGSGLHFDSTRTALDGNAEELLIGKFNGFVRFQSAFQRQSAGYEINDLGFLLRADDQNWNTWAGLFFNTPTALYKSLGVNFNQMDTWTTGGMSVEHAYNTNFHTNLTNNWWLYAGATLGQTGGAFCDRCARGGPALRRSAQVYPWFGVQGDDRRSIVPSLWVNLWTGDQGRSGSVNLNPSADFRVSTQLDVNVGLGYIRNSDDNQWYGNFTDSVNATHYAFAHLHQRTALATMQASYAATPTLTLELYAEPFVSVGQYDNIRQESATPAAVAYEARYAPFAPPAGSSTGFDNRQLIWNTVMRWEYRPGSTLFVVWTQGRDEAGGMYPNESLGAEYRNLFAVHPANTFLVKVAYWLNR